MYRRELENVSDETILKRRKAEIVKCQSWPQYKAPENTNRRGDRKCHKFGLLTLIGGFHRYFNLS